MGERKACRMSTISLISTLPLAWMSLGRSRGPSPIPVSDDTDVVTVEPLSKGTVGHILSMLPLGDWGLLTGTKVEPVVWVLPMAYMLWRLKFSLPIYELLSRRNATPSLVWSFGLRIRDALCLQCECTLWTPYLWGLLERPHEDGCSPLGGRLHWVSILMYGCEPQSCQMGTCIRDLHS